MTPERASITCCGLQHSSRAAAIALRRGLTPAQRLHLLVTTHPNLSVQAVVNLAVAFGGAAGGGEGSPSQFGSFADLQAELKRVIDRLESDGQSVQLEAHIGRLREIPAVLAEARGQDDDERIMIAFAEGGRLRPLRSLAAFECTYPGCPGKACIGGTLQACVEHGGEHPHKCDDCDAAFGTASHLTRHKRTHDCDLVSVSV